MRETRLLMGMPVTVEVGNAGAGTLAAVFAYLEAIDRRFSTYREDSEVQVINRGERQEVDYSEDMREVLALAEETARATHGYFDIRRADGSIDPSGIVKGWAIRNAAALIQASGGRIISSMPVAISSRTAVMPKASAWRVGIRNPFNPEEIVKVVRPQGRGVATSGTYVRGQHIYDPHDRAGPLTEFVGLTVIGPDVLEADRYATAAFAMGREGIVFIESMPGLEGYAIDKNGRATLTSGFGAFCVS